MSMIEQIDGASSLFAYRPPAGDQKPKTYTGMTLEEASLALVLPFPPEALSERPSSGKGPSLTGVEVAYVVERMNKVFGFCGLGWKFEIVEHPALRDSGKTIHCVVRVAVNLIGVGWCEWVYSYGQSQVNAYLSGGDAAKSAISDGIKKAVSYMGVALDVYKGNQTVDDPNMGQVFVEQAREQIKGIDSEAVKHIMGKLGLTKDNMTKATLEQQTEFFRLVDVIKTERDKIATMYYGEPKKEEA